MSNFRPIDRQTGFLLPPSVDEWLPEKHLARFVVEVIDGLDLRVMRGSYRGSGSASYPPSLLLGILVYGYATGVFSSRKLERATYDSVAFRFIAANQHPDREEYGQIKGYAPPAVLLDPLGAERRLKESPVAPDLRRREGARRADRRSPDASKDRLSPGAVPVPAVAEGARGPHPPRRADGPAAGAPATRCGRGAPARRARRQGK